MRMAMGRGDNAYRANPRFDQEPHSTNVRCVHEGRNRRTKRRSTEQGGEAAVRFRSRKLLLGVAAAMAVVVPAGFAWGCVALVSFRTTGPGVVQPGGTVEVFGGEFAQGKPVHIRLDSPDGPILYTHPDPRPSTMTSRFTVQVPIPQNVPSGPHVLVATQEHYDMNVGIPARAAIYVNSSPPVAPTPEERPTSLSVSSGPSAARYVLIGLAVAGGGLLLAAVARAIASRRPSPGPPTA